MFRNSVSRVSDFDLFFIDSSHSNCIGLFFKNRQKFCRCGEAALLPCLAAGL